jgi:hypothetical protein
MASVESDGPTGFSQVLEASVATQSLLRSREPIDPKLRRRLIREPILYTSPSRVFAPAAARFTPRARIMLILSTSSYSKEKKDWLITTAGEEEIDITNDGLRIKLEAMC